MKHTAIIKKLHKITRLTSVHLLTGFSTQQNINFNSSSLLFNITAVNFRATAIYKKIPQRTPKSVVKKVH